MKTLISVTTRPGFFQSKIVHHTNSTYVHFHVQQVFTSTLKRILISVCCSYFPFSIQPIFLQEERKQRRFCGFYSFTVCEICDVLSDKKNYVSVRIRQVHCSSGQNMFSIVTTKTSNSMPILELVNHIRNKRHNGRQIWSLLFWLFLHSISVRGGHHYLFWPSLFVSRNCMENQPQWKMTTFAFLYVSHFLYVVDCPQTLGGFC